MPYEKHHKRLLDITGALVALVVLAPVLCVAALVVWIGLGSPVLFRQTRTGRAGKLFTIYKLRTMREGSDQLLDEQRMTTVGRFLRSTSVDELPELWNVLKGEMSLVGPRPLLPQYLGRYTPQQARRHEVLPGITGWAQVNGRNSLTWEEKFELDVWYVDHVSFALDLRILVRTAVHVLARRGIEHSAAATAPEFVGSSER
jgi:sugar transferase EpsL